MKPLNSRRELNFPRRRKTEIVRAKTSFDNVIKCKLKESKLHNLSLFQHSDHLVIIAQTNLIYSSLQANEVEFRQWNRGIRWVVWAVEVVESESQIYLPFARFIFCGGNWRIGENKSGRRLFITIECKILTQKMLRFWHIWVNVIRFNGSVERALSPWFEFLIQFINWLEKKIRSARKTLILE